jgi:hypothetical protein
VLADLVVLADPVLLAGWGPPAAVGPQVTLRLFHRTGCLTRMMEKSRPGHQPAEQPWTGPVTRREPLTWTFTGR